MSHTETSREYVAATELELCKVEDELAAVRAQRDKLLAGCKRSLQFVRYINEYMLNTPNDGPLAAFLVKAIAEVEPK